MTAIVMLVCGGLFALIAAMLRFEPNARILTQYSDNAVAQKNRWASKYLFLIAVFSLAAGAAALSFPQFSVQIFSVWLGTVVVNAFFVASKS